MTSWKSADPSRLPEVDGFETHIPWFSRCFRKESKKIVTLSGDSDFAKKTTVFHIHQQKTINGGVHGTINYTLWLFNIAMERWKDTPFLIGQPSISIRAISHG